MATVAAPPDEEGWCSLALHAGGTVKELERAGADPERLLVVEVSANFPRTLGLPPKHAHALHLDQIDILTESEAQPFALPEAEPGPTDEAIAANARAFIPDGATLQTGIGAIPSAIAGRLAEGDGGSEELYRWLDGNADVAFLPVEVVNSPDLIGRNRLTVTINAAMAVDLHGQVVADTISGTQYSGIGGHEDFVAGPVLALEDRSLLCLPSTVTIDGEVHSRIVPWFEAGAVITTPRHQVDVVVTEHGAAELQGLTVHQRGKALAGIAHPDFRDELLEAAERASGGRSAVPTSD
jgi:acyl-CoA hydrolase